MADEASAVSRAFALPPPAPTLLDGVLASALSPGAGPGLVAAVNASLLVMLAATGWIAWTLDGEFARRMAMATAQSLLLRLTQRSQLSAVRSVLALLVQKYKY